MGIQNSKVKCQATLQGKLWLIMMKIMLKTKLKRHYGPTKIYKICKIYFLILFWISELKYDMFFTMIHLYFEVSTIAGSLTCSLYLKVIAAAYSWPTSGSTGPWIALLASQSLPSSTEILVCNVIRQFFFVPPVWQWHTVQWFSGVCILSTHSCRKNTCCSESWDNYSDLETILRSLKVYSSVFPPPTHTCHADLRSGAVISQPKWTGASWEDNRSFLSPFHLIVWDFKDLLAGGSENAFSLTSNMVCVCVGVCVCVCVRGCVFIFLLPPAVQCFSPHPWQYLLGVCDAL